MAVASYELTKLDPNSFEHLANSLALRVLGAGHTGFGPGPDGGRDGYFVGTAPYPSTQGGWSGTWYIQSKFLAPHLTKDQHKWLLERVTEELKAFSDPSSRRVWPDNWIIVTNVDPSGAPATGSFDRALALVKGARPELAKRFHIWGGRKVLNLLAQHPELTEYYAEFVTPGIVLSTMYKQAQDAQAQIEQIVRYLVVTQFNEQQYTRLEQAGSTTDNRPGIHRLFADVPYVCAPQKKAGMAATALAKALARSQRLDLWVAQSQAWKEWQEDPERARVWFIKGGPGQGKSTLTQYMCQIQRAALMVAPGGPSITPTQKALVEEVEVVACAAGLWPLVPRIPVTIDLKEFAFWFGKKRSENVDRIVAYLSEWLTKQLGEEVKPGTLRRAFSSARWLFVFDGLDEVPGDVKDAVAAQVTYFVDDFLIGCDSEAAIVCTSRPQGYSGQFSRLDAANVELTSLSRDQALACAEPLLALDRSEIERQSYVNTLRAALQSPTIAEIMTTPLQAHIMAVIVRDGGKPPERKWQLFHTFYQVIKKREANRNLPDQKLAKLLREGDKLLKALHNRLGFELHARAEISDGATTALARSELKVIVREVVSQLQDRDVEETVATLMEATTQRLVLVSTPEAGDYVRFDIRPLQEFFAAEQMYESGEPDAFVERVRVIAGDSHWREVMHFLLSALIEQNRKGELAAAVTVLAQIDGGAESSIRSINRRLARGGIVAARLLQEGVLEQDKRVREQFRSSIVSLLGAVDADKYVTDVSTEHSRSWLIDVLIACLRESSEAESIGASIALAKALPDSDGRAPLAVQVLAQSSLGYQLAFCELLDAALPDENIAAWVLTIPLGLLLREDWHAVVSWEDVATLKTILSRGSKRLRAAGLQLGLPSSVADRLEAIFGTPRDLHSRSEGKPQLIESLYGILEVHYFEPDQKLLWEKWSRTEWRDFAKTTGILKSSYWGFEFLRTGDSQIFREFLASIGGAARFPLLPQAVRVFFVEDFQNVCENTTEESGVPGVVERARPGHTSTLVLNHSREEIEWQGACSKFPYLVTYLLGDDELTSMRYLKDPSHQEALIDALRRQNVMPGDVERWGKLFSLPSPLGTTLRELAIARADVRPSKYWYQAHLATFALELPREAPLLPHIANVLVQTEEMHHKAPLYVSYGNVGSAKRRDIRQTVAEYITDSDTLARIANDRRATQNEYGQLQ